MSMTEKVQSLNIVSDNDNKSNSEETHLSSTNVMRWNIKRQNAPGGVTLYAVQLHLRIIVYFVV